MKPGQFAKEEKQTALSSDFDQEHPASRFPNTASVPQMEPDSPTTSLDGIKKKNLIRVPMWFQITILALHSFFCWSIKKKQRQVSDLLWSELLFFMCVFFSH